MRCFWRIPGACILLAFLLSGCGSRHGVFPPGTSAHSGGGNFSVDGFTAKVTEYPLPAGTTPSDVTVGADGAIWFANFQSPFTTSIAAGRITGNGAVKLVSLPTATEVDLISPYTSGAAAIASTGGKLWTIGIEPFRMRDQFLASIAITGSVDLSDIGISCCAEPSPKLTVDRQGNLWLGTCADACTFGMTIFSFTPAGITRASARIGDPVNSYTPNGIAAGPDGNIYLTATFTGLESTGFAPQTGFVFKISPTGGVLQQIPLPVHSDPHGITAGPDGNLWIAETGTGKIARVSTGGAVNEFPLLNAASQPLNIAKGSDGALWFTEFAGNALGRITTDGQITEYPIPTPNSEPYGLVSCPSACNNAHGRIWFSEQTGKMAKFEF